MRAKRWYHRGLRPGWKSNANTVRDGEPSTTSNVPMSLDEKSNIVTEELIMIISDVIDIHVHLQSTQVLLQDIKDPLTVYFFIILATCTVVFEPPQNLRVDFSHHLLKLSLLLALLFAVIFV